MVVYVGAGYSSCGRERVVHVKIQDSRAQAEVEPCWVVKLSAAKYLC